MNERQLIIQPATDAEYAAWTKANPGGHILNVPRFGNADVLWHEVGCSTILANGNTPFVEGAYYKLCSLNPGALAEAAKKLPNPLRYCTFCRNRWTNEH